MHLISALLIFIVMVVTTAIIIFITLMAAGVVMDVIVDQFRDGSEYCTDICILKPENYGPELVLEDPDYNEKIHDRDVFNTEKYYLRRLSRTEISAQRSPGMLYEIMQDMRLSCMYKGKTEIVTCPAGCVFNGDSLKYILNIENDGVAWIFHDWIYQTHSFDVREDGTQTLIPREKRWIVDELMFSVIELDGYVLYARIAKTLDSIIDGILYNAWGHVEHKHDCSYVKKTE